MSDDETTRPTTEELLDESAPADPTFLRDTETDQVSIDWHGERPDAVRMPTDMLEAWVKDRNDYVAAIARLESLAQERAALVAILRMGRRPNRADWERAELHPVKPIVDIRERLKGDAR